MILRSGGFAAPAQLGECSRIAPKPAFFKTQAEDRLNCCEYHSKTKSCTFSATLEKGVLHNAVTRDYVQKIQARQQTLSRIRNSPLLWSFLYATV